MSSDNDIDESEGVEVKGKSKKILIIIVLLVVLLGGAAGGMYFMGMLPFGGEETHSEEGEDAGEHGADAEEGEGHGGSGEEASGEHGGEGEGGAPAHAGIVYYELPEFLVNLQSNGKRSSFLKMKVMLELPNEEARLALQAMEPRIVDGFNTYLRELRSSDLAGSAGIYRLREELLLRINKTVQPSRVNDILFKEILVQ